jgi:hypothetical protein
MAAAILLDRAGASFSIEPFATGSGFSFVCDFSIIGAFSGDDTRSLEDFAIAGAFSVADAFAVVEFFSVFAFGLVEVFSAAVDFGFVATFPFGAELALVGAGVFAGVVAFVEGFSVRVFPVETVMVAESVAAFGAVSGRPPRAQALAMTMAISGSRARPVISSLVEGYSEQGDVPVRPILRLERTAATTCPLDSSAKRGVYHLGSVV